LLKTADYGKALLQLAKRIQLEIAPKVDEIAARTASVQNPD
jgi:hypothetical protein